MDWAAEICGHLWTGPQRPAETHGLGCGDLWTPLDWATEIFGLGIGNMKINAIKI